MHVDLLTQSNATGRLSAKLQPREVKKQGAMQKDSIC